jgi:murein DD-endopeptidase MepM/ murein hydrolase activator NlpD
MNPLIVNPPLNGLENRVTSTSSTDQSSSDSTQFMTLLSELLSSTGSSSSSDPLNGGGLLSPMIITLVEQLLAAQIQGEGSTAASQSAVSGSSASLFSQLQAFGSTSNGLQSVASLPAQSAPQEGSPQGLPVHGPLTQNFHPGHNGLDFGVVVGTPAKATMPGKIVYAGWNNQGYGNLVIVQNGPYQVYYGHLSQIPVQVGQTVSAGETVGLTGNTGHSTGPHLHYEVRKDGKVIDPTSFTLGSQ